MASGLASIVGLKDRIALPKPTDPEKWRFCFAACRRL
jgi:hypothetical protein